MDRGTVVVCALISILTGGSVSIPTSAFASAYSVTSGFAANANPNGPWTYGWVGNIGGTFTALQIPHNSIADHGLIIPSWQLTSYQTPAVYVNTSSNTASAGGGLVLLPPGTCWFYPGEDGRPENFGVIRFTVPAGGTGGYNIAAAVAPVYNGSPQGDTDFHIVKNGTELFGQFLTPSGSAGYTNALNLAEGDTIDFVIGRGADGSAYGSGLRIQASLTTDINIPIPPSILTQPQSQVVGLGSNVTFVVVAEGEIPLSYQWRHNGLDITDATNATLVIENVQDTDAGAYTVQVSNSNGSTVSTAAILTVVVPPPPGSYDANRDFSLASNPNGAWSYGYKPTVGGVFSLITFPLTQPAGNGVLVQSWQLNRHSEPAIFCNTSSETATSGSVGNYPPGTIWFFGGYPGTGQDLGAIRFTLPVGEDGAYRLEVAVQHYLDGPPAGDTEFHVAKNGTELFGQFLSPTDRTGYTNTLNLTAGDTIDLLAGRGIDNQLYGSGLKIAARITRTDITNIPPFILVQPQSQTVSAGSSATFSVIAEGTAPLTYQWLFDGNDLPDAINSSLIIPEVAAANVGRYSVRVANSFGTVTSVEAKLDVIVPPPPGSYDANRDFSLASNPNGAWSYGFMPSVNGPFSLITFPLTQPAGNGVLVQSWQLSRYSEPAIFCNTSSETATSGSAGNYPPGTIWFFGGYPGTGQDLGAIRFTLPTGEDGAYRLEVAVQHYLDGPPAGDTEFHVAKNGTELFGQFLSPTDRTGYTNTLNLTAGDTIDLLAGRGADNQLYGSGLKIAARITRTDITNIPPFILVQPQSQTVSAGSNVTFSVIAEGTAPLTYQWIFDGNDLPDAINSSLVIPEVAAANVGRYSVRVANSFGTVTSVEAKLDVIVPPPPGSFDLSRDFSAAHNPAGAWSFGWSESIGGTFTLLTVPHVSHAGNVVIPSWQLTSYQTPAVYQNNSTELVSIAGGQGVFPPGTVWYYPGEDGRPENFGVIRFTVPAGAAGAYHLETTVRSVYEGSLSHDTDFHVVKNGAEIFGQFLPANSATSYSNTLALSVGDIIDFVIGRGADNSQYASGLKIQATLNLDDSITDVPPLIVSQPQGQTTTAGSSVTFSVSAEGTAPLAYQWRFNGSDLPGETNASLSLANVTLAAGGVYSVRVTNPIGSTTSTDALLTVEPVDVPPSILAQPVSRTALPGETVVFSVTAGGSSPLSYQWRVDGTDIPNANSNRLVLTSVQISDAGAYSVVVSNPHGTATSDNAQLVVTNTVVAGGTVNFANRSSSTLNIPIFDVDGVTRVAGPNFRAQLYAGATMGALIPVGPSAVFSTNGSFAGGTRIIPDVAPGQVAYVQVRVWDNLSGTNYDLALSAGGKAGASSVFSVITGGSGMPPTFPARLDGLTSFSLIQGGFSLAMAPVRKAPTLLPAKTVPGGKIVWRLSGDAWATYIIEYSSDLQEWQPLKSVFADSGTVEFSDPAAPGSTTHRFYRARLSE